MTDFAQEVQERWKAAEEADKENREEALLDLEFAAGKQWDDTTRDQREGQSLPCLTINTIPQFVGQVVGDRRANQTSIKVLPREDGDKDVAEIRSELIRSIELQSKADRVFSQAFEQAVTCGVGNIRVDMEYADEDAFERDLFINAIPNPLAVLWDPMAADPTGKDAGFCFVQERIQKSEYERRFKEAASDSLNDNSLARGNWVDDNTVRVAEFWELIEKAKTVAMQMDGKVIDITGKKPADLAGSLVINPATGEPYMRETTCKYAKRTLTNGKEQLEKPFELKIPRLPIIRVSGREVWIGNERLRFGLVRFIRDNKRLENYMMSVAAQKLMFAPRHNWMAEHRAIKGLKGDYTDVLTYNDNANPPVAATQYNLQSLVEMSQLFSQKMKEASGIYEANLGSRSNETSGVAIRARQAEGDNATIIYHDNMNAAQQEAGEILNALIPVVYDTARTIRTVGQDDAVKVIRINDPEHPESVDLSVGKYDVTIATGPKYETQRQEASSALMELAGRNPKLAEVAGDLIIKALDIPGGDKIAERIKKTIPPEVLGDDADDDKTPEEIQAQEERAAQAEQAKQAMMELEMRTKAAEAAKAEAEARRANAEAEKAEAETMELKAGLALKGAALAEHATEVEELNEGEM